MNVRNGRGAPLGGNRGNIPPNVGDRGRPLGGGNKAKNKKFKAFSGAPHSMADK